MTVSNESSRQTFMDNEIEEDRERGGPTSSSTTCRLVDHGGGHRKSCRMEKENPCG